MKGIFDTSVSKIIADNAGYYFITAETDSKVLYVSKDNDIKQIEAYNKATYVYKYDKNNIFIPSMYYRAFGYHNKETKKYRTKIDLLEGARMAVCDNENIYY